MDIYYWYDSYGNLSAIRYADGTVDNIYYVVCNSRGDVEAFYNGSGTVKSRYVYDSWGNVIKVVNANGVEITNQNDVAFINPIRYRGYYFDSETGLYYINSRYYDPAVGRFINEDSQLNTVEGIIGYNLFSYCGNNPVNRSDARGNSWWGDFKKSAGELWDDVTDTVSSVRNSSKKWVSNAWNSTTTWVSNSWNWTKQTVSSAWNWTKQTASSAWNWTKQTASSAWNWTKQTASSTWSFTKNVSGTVWGGIKTGANAVKDFAIDRFSTPEKSSNTFSAIGWGLDSAAAYCAGIAANLSIPTLGMSVTTAGTAAAIVAISSLPFHGIALIIDIFNEE